MSSPIKPNDAKEIALAHLKQLETGANLELVLVEIRELPFGWLFFYDSKRHQETREFKYAIAGNVPFLITRKDGRVHTTGTARPVEEYLSAFEGY